MYSTKSHTRPFPRFTDYYVSASIIYVQLGVAPDPFSPMSDRLSYFRSPILLVPHPSTPALYPHTSYPSFPWVCPLNTIFSSTPRFADRR